MCSLLAGTLVDTKGRLEKKQAQTYEEMLVGSGAQCREVCA